MDSKSRLLGETFQVRHLDGCVVFSNIGCQVRLWEQSPTWRSVNQCQTFRLKRHLEKGIAFKLFGRNVQGRNAVQKIGAIEQVKKPNQLFVPGIHFQFDRDGNEIVSAYNTLIGGHFRILDLA